MDRDSGHLIGLLVVVVVIVALIAGFAYEFQIPTSGPSTPPVTPPSTLAPSQPSSSPSPAPSAPPSSQPSPPPSKSGGYGEEEILRIGAFNIQAFGPTKSSKSDVMDIIARIIRTYDVVAIQELRDKSQTALPALIDLVNADCSR